MTYTKFLDFRILQSWQCIYHVDTALCPSMLVHHQHWREMKGKKRKTFKTSCTCRILFEKHTSSWHCEQTMEGKKIKPIKRLLCLQVEKSDAHGILKMKGK